MEIRDWNKDLKTMKIQIKLCKELARFLSEYCNVVPTFVGSVIFYGVNYEGWETLLKDVDINIFSKGVYKGCKNIDDLFVLQHYLKKYTPYNENVYKVRTFLQSINDDIQSKFLYTTQFRNDIETIDAKVVGSWPTSLLSFIFKNGYKKPITLDVDITVSSTSPILTYYFKIMFDKFNLIDCIKHTKEILKSLGLIENMPKLLNSTSIYVLFCTFIMDLLEQQLKDMDSDSSNNSDSKESTSDSNDGTDDTKTDSKNDNNTGNIRPKLKGYKELISEFGPLYNFKSFEYQEMHEKKMVQIILKFFLFLVKFDFHKKRIKFDRKKNRFVIANKKRGNKIQELIIINPFNKLNISGSTEYPFIIKKLVHYLKYITKNRKYSNLTDLKYHTSTTKRTLLL